MKYVSKSNTIQINEARLEGYAYGCIETWLENFAKSHNLPPDGLAYGVAEALLTMGQGSESEVRSVHQDTSIVHRPVEPLAVGGDARSSSTPHRKLSPSGLRRIRAAQEERWRKYRAEEKKSEGKKKETVKAEKKAKASPYSKKHPHWTQLSKNKKKLMRTVQAMQRGKRLAA